MAARAAFVAGFDGAATTLAGKLWGLPLYGTMAHAFIQAYDDEAKAFEDFARSRPEAGGLAHRHLRHRSRGP